MEEVFAPYRDVRDALLVIDGIALALAAVIGTLLGRSATRPIGQLVEAAHRIQEGQYEVSVEASGGKEFRSLAAAFNAMQRTIAEREADITHRVYHDSVTGLPNRAFAEQRLEELIRAAKPGVGSALILIDARNVREINGSLGHHVGDDVMREAARRMRQNAGATDVVVRVAESQFLVIAQNCSVERAVLYADQLAGVVRSGFHLAGTSLDLNVAASVCVHPDHGDTADELLRRVQIALEDADDARGRIATYRPGSDEVHRRRLALITDLRTAIAADSLTLVYQPKVAMATQVRQESRGAGALDSSAARERIARRVRAARGANGQFARSHQLGAQGRDPPDARVAARRAGGRCRRQSVGAGHSRSRPGR